jgi:hypothetical protein
MRFAKADLGGSLALVIVVLMWTPGLWLPARLQHDSWMAELWIALLLGATAAATFAAAKTQRRLLRVLWVSTGAIAGFSAFVLAAAWAAPL